MAQTAGVCSFLDRQWTLEDVILIPSDSESETDSDAEMMGQDVTRVHLTHNQDPDDSLPSISAIVASMVDVGHGLAEAIRSSTQDLGFSGERDRHYSSTSGSPREVIFRSALDGSGTTDSDELVSPAIQQHGDGVSPAMSTSIRGPRVVSSASEYSAHYAPMSPPRDGALHQEDVHPPCQPQLASETIIALPFQSQNRNAVSSSECGQTVGHDHVGEAVPQSDDELHSVARSASANTPALGCGHPVSRREGWTEGTKDFQEHQVAGDILPVDSCLSSPPIGQGQDEERQRRIHADHAVSQLDEPCEGMEKRLSNRRGFRIAYNLRPLPTQRQLAGEQKDGGSNEDRVPQSKRRKLVYPQPKKHSSQQGSEPERNRKACFLRNDTTKRRNNASVAITKWPARSSVVSYEAWPLGCPILRCTRENGTAIFQLQFTSDILWNALAAQSDPAEEGHHQPPNIAEDQNLRTREERSNQHTENMVQSIQSAYPGVSPDVYRMNCLIARWRQHTFLVKWSDATTTWEPRKHIIDKKILRDFEASWQGFDEGVDVLATRLRSGKLQRLLHWHGRPSKEDTWVRNELLSPQLMRRIQSN